MTKISLVSVALLASTFAFTILGFTPAAHAESESQCKQRCDEDKQTNPYDKKVCKNLCETEARYQSIKDTNAKNKSGYEQCIKLSCRGGFTTAASYQCVRDCKATWDVKPEAPTTCEARGNPQAYCTKEAMNCFEQAQRASSVAQHRILARQCMRSYEVAKYVGWVPSDIDAEIAGANSPALRKCLTDAKSATNETDLLGRRQVLIETCQKNHPNTGSGSSSASEPVDGAAPVTVSPAHQACLNSAKSLKGTAQTTRIAYCNKIFNKSGAQPAASPAPSPAATPVPSGVSPAHQACLNTANSLSGGAKEARISFCNKSFRK